MIETIKRFKRSKRWKLLGCRYLDFSITHNGYNRDGGAGGAGGGGGFSPANFKQKLNI